jgi:hypothetical protein
LLAAAVVVGIPILAVAGIADATTAQRSGF